METDVAPLPQLWPMPAEPLPIVVIGAGGIVRDAHLPAYAKWGLPVAGIFDIDRARAWDLADRFGIAAVFDNLSEATARGTDVVYDVALPPQALADTLDHLPRGALALIQKPLGTDAADAHRLAGVLKARDITAAVNFQLQFTPSMVALREAIGRDWFGRIVEVDVRVATRTPWEEWPFMAELEHIEIPLHSIHYLDWIRGEFGQPRAVYARSLPHPDHPDRADARSSIILDYDRDLRCCLSLNHTHMWGTKHEQAELRVEGTEGAAIVGMGYLLNFPDGAPEYLKMVRRDEAWRDIPLAGARVPDSFAAVMANLQRFTAGEDERLVTGLAGSVATMDLVEACLRSHDSGEAVRLSTRHQ